jgi:two-component system, OmpR family, response regulator MprA
MRSASSVVHRRIRAAMRASRGHNDLTGSPKGHGKILVVEHDLMTREALAMMLKYYGYDVTVASDGREATRLLSQVTPDLVVMDWRTPGLSGLSLCLALRRRWPMIPIVVVTSSDEVLDDDQPANAWLQKPIDPPLLNQVIHNELAPVRSA